MLNNQTIEQQSTRTLGGGTNRKAASNPRSFMRHRMAQQKQDLTGFDQNNSNNQTARSKSRHIGNANQTIDVMNGGTRKGNTNLNHN